MEAKRYIIAASLFTLVMLGLDYYCVRNLLHQKAAKKYLPTTGHVELYRVENKISFFTRRLHPQVILVYNYRVNGQDYRGSIYRYTERIPPPDDAELLPEGREISVFYDSDHPKEAVLSRAFTVDDMQRLPLLAFLNLMMFSLFGLWVRGRVLRAFHPPRLWQS